jgi:D-serine deaminase-like pyridoxal phosphate-dependent protein
MSIEERLEGLGAVPDTPALLVDATVMRDNIERMASAARAGGKDLRPHAKTHKIPQIARLQLDAGAVGLQVAKLGEADVFADAGATDIFVGYPIVGEHKIRRLLDLAERIEVSVSLDDLEVAEPIGRAASQRGLVMPVMLEIDTGLHRVGVSPDERAVDVAERIASIPGLRLKGVMTHQGQAYAASDAEELAALDDEACTTIVSVAESIRARGVDCPVVSVGSTVTSRFDARAEGVTEIRPGIYVFNDATQVGHGHSTWEQTAVWAVATVVSRPGPDRAVVDAGNKVLSSDPLHYGGAALSYGQVMGMPGHVVARVSEEHGVIATPPGSTLRIGDRVAIVPNHICPVLNLADEVLVAEDGRIIDRWPVAARGKVR